MRCTDTHMNANVSIYNIEMCCKTKCGSNFAETFFKYAEGVCIRIDYFKTVLMNFALGNSIIYYPQAIPLLGPYFAMIFSIDIDLKRIKGNKNALFSLRLYHISPLHIHRRIMICKKHKPDL